MCVCVCFSFYFSLFHFSFTIYLGFYLFLHLFSFIKTKVLCFCLCHLSWVLFVYFLSWLFFHCTVWLAGSWFPNQGLGLSLWSGSAKARTLDHWGIPCWCSVTKLCLALCNPMGCNTPGSSAFHYLIDFAQIHVHWVNAVIKHILYHCTTWEIPENSETWGILIGKISTESLYLDSKILNTSH